MSFDQHRPRSHFIAPHSWMNDPCGAIYIPETKEYLVGYQWNPGHTEGGNSAWGMAVSTDLITWTDLQPAICNGETYDRLGVFSGSITSQIENGKRILYLFYTSVSALPIHWSKPYTVGCETQSLAMSYDFGRTWEKFRQNPILRKPPNGHKTTGWRDPFVSEWPALSELCGWSPETKWMMISGGQKGKGPQLLIYRNRGLGLLNWELIGPILSCPSGEMIADDSELQWGRNFECASFFTLGENHYVVLGVEEDIPPGYRGPLSKHHANRSLLWLGVDLELDNGRPRLVVTSHGKLDHGMAYAGHIFRDEEGRLIQLAWADEQLDDQRKRKQGWAGCLTHPRELFEIKKRWPLDPSKYEPTHIWNVERSGPGKEAGMMTTLGIRPAPQVDALRHGLFAMPLLKSKSQVNSRSFELKIKIRNCERLASDMEIKERTRDAYVKDDFYTHLVKRGKCGALVLPIFKNFVIQFSITPEDGYEIVIRQPGRGVETSQSIEAQFSIFPGEDLEMRVFVDRSIIEIFANDLVAITARAYPQVASAMGATWVWHDGDEVFMDKYGPEEAFKKLANEEKDVEVMYWKGLQSAWPCMVRPQLMEPQEESSGAECSAPERLKVESEEEARAGKSHGKARMSLAVRANSVSSLDLALSISTCRVPSESSTFKYSF